MTQDELLRKLEGHMKDWRSRQESCEIMAATKLQGTKMGGSLSRIADIWKWCADVLESLVSEAKADEDASWDHARDAYGEEAEEVDR